MKLDPNIGYDPLTYAGLVAVVCIVIAFVIGVLVVRYALRVERRDRAEFITLEELTQPRSAPPAEDTAPMLVAPVGRNRERYAASVAKAFREIR